jgi:hypothetical protein
MKHISKGSLFTGALISAGVLILAGLPAKAVQEKRRDPFIGEWLLSIHSAPGPEITREEITVALKISEKGSFYDVKLQVPNIYNSAEVEYAGFSWAKFVKQSDKSLKNMTAGLAKRKYSGEYLMDIEGRSITHQNGSVTFLYKTKSGMLCETGLGCFTKGDQRALIERYKEQQRELAEARVRAAAEAKAEAKARAKADAEARAEAKARNEAEIERIRAFHGPYTERSWKDAVEYCRINGGRLPSMNEHNRTANLGNLWYWLDDGTSIKRGAIGTVSTDMKSLSYTRCVQ